MQDPNTGDMVPIDEEQIKQLTMAPQESISEESQLEDNGYCILHEGETIDIKGGKFKVLSIGKKEIQFACPENIFKLGIKKQERLKIKNGNFKVNYFGDTFLFVSGLPGNHPLDQKIIDEARKKAIKRLRSTDETINTDAINAVTESIEPTV